MSKRILEALKYYNELYTDDPESELVHIKADLDRALLGAPLDDEERALLSLLYLSEPEHPLRGQQDKNGGTSGRPAGGTSQVLAARLVITQTSTEKARELRAGRIIRRAAAKLALFLGDDYE